jgi:hypothetical protein
MKQNHLFILVLFALISFNSCKKESTDNQSSTPTTPIPYLAIGNKWVYNVTGGITGYSTFTKQIISNNNGVYVSSTLWDNTAGTAVYEYSDHGFLDTYDEGETQGANQHLVEYTNPKVGDTWTRITPSETYYHTMVSIDTSITVAAGTFVCNAVKTEFKNAFNDQYTYWSNQYGQIKIDGLELSTELASKNF